MAPFLIFCTRVPRSIVSAPFVPLFTQDFMLPPNVLSSPSRHESTVSLYVASDHVVPGYPDQRQEDSNAPLYSACARSDSAIKYFPIVEASWAGRNGQNGWVRWYDLPHENGLYRSIHFSFSCFLLYSSFSFFHLFSSSLQLTSLI